MAQRGFELFDRADHVKTLPRTTGAGDDPHAAGPQAERFKDLVPDPNLLFGLGRKADANRVTDPGPQQIAHTDRRFDCPADQPASLGNPQMQRAIDRFGKLPTATENLLTLIRIKQNCVKAGIARLDVGGKGALVAFHNDQFANPTGLIDYVQRLAGAAKLRPDNKLVITRVWPDGAARLHAGLQLSKGLAKVAG